MMYCVYCHTNKANGKKYFGITQQKPQRRWNRGEGYKHNRYFYGAIQKYGWNGFDHDVIMDGLSKEDAIEIERFLIASHQTTNREKGYNISEGGELGCKGFHPIMTDELRAKIGKSIRESERFKANRVTWNKGKHYTKEQYEKYLNAWSFTSEDAKRKTSESVKKLWQDEAYREHMKMVHIGENLKSVCCIETNIIYPSLQDAQAKTGIRYECISKCCNGKQRTAGGFRWKYAEV